MNAAAAVAAAGSDAVVCSCIGWSCVECEQSNELNRDKAKKETRSIHKMFVEMVLYSLAKPAIPMDE